MSDGGLVDELPEFDCVGFDRFEFGDDPPFPLSAVDSLSAIDPMSGSAGGEDDLSGRKLREVNPEIAALSGSEDDASDGDGFRKLMAVRGHDMNVVAVGPADELRA